MNYKMLVGIWYACLITIPNHSVFPQGIPRGVGDGLRVVCRTDEHNLVLGEPLHLIVEVENTSARVIEHRQVWGERGGLEIQTYIASARDDSGQFKRYEMGIYSQRNYEPTTEPIRPGEIKRYELWILHSKVNERRLAFPDSGAFTIYVEYPLIVDDPKSQSFQKSDVRSNELKIRVVEPESQLDKLIWREYVREPHFVRFLQSGRVSTGHEDDTARTAALVEQLRGGQESRYFRPLVRALHEHYLEYFRHMTEEEQKVVLSALKMTHMQALGREPFTDKL